ncbi:MAG: ATP-binding cassette domain-containing protein [Endomicrobium sp.]|jgi:D-methionine transport system ATP-binding protein|nr:ATP-binding cassette domain-containing protein [Endomicrobium sp.]
MVAPFIEIKNVSKKFKNHNQDQEFYVLKDINLEIQKGDIFGIIGFNGAGKSTLIRCINRLETVSSGTIHIGNYEVDKLSKKEMNLYRQKIGMIFQHFNLFDSRTVYDNVAFPLEVSGKSKQEIKKRVFEILELVSISDKKDFYPGQLSGGQKQRLGIARALANSPDILLSDEATSALDPVTSLSVLDLLKDINKKFGITIILITHSLDVIKYTCNNMAVLEDGLIVENGRVRKIFTKPSSETAKVFIKNNSNLAKFDYLGGGDGI